MNGIQITRTRRRIANAVDAIQRLDAARMDPRYAQTSHIKRMQSHQAAQRDEIFSTFDALVQSHSEVDALRQQVAALQKENGSLKSYKTAMFSLAYGAPSRVLAEATRPQVAGCDQSVKYTGHGAKTGGLQQHSIGDEYPFITHMRGDKWRILDSRTGNTHYSAYTTSLAAHEAALALAKSARSRNNNLAIGADGWPYLYKEENDAAAVQNERP